MDKGCYYRLNTFKIKGECVYTTATTITHGRSMERLHESDVGADIAKRHGKACSNNRRKIGNGKILDRDGILVTRVLPMTDTTVAVLCRSDVDTSTTVTGLRFLEVVKVSFWAVSPSLGQTVGTVDPPNTRVMVFTTRSGGGEETTVFPPELAMFWPRE